MNLYTVAVTVKVAAASEGRAYHVIKHALNRGTLDEEIVYVDAETIAQRPDDDEPEQQVICGCGRPFYRSETATEVCATCYELWLESAYTKGPRAAVDDEIIAADGDVVGQQPKDNEPEPAT